MRARPAIRAWHRWFGIVCGLWLMLLAATGFAITWYDEIDRALNPDLRSAAVSSTAPAPIATALERAAVALPGFAADNIILAQRPGDTHWLLGRQTLPDGSARPLQAFADPATGATLGWRESGAVSLHRHHLPDLLYGLHTDLLAGEAGLLLIGIVGIAWLIDHFVAIPLAIPRWRGWLRAFRIAGPAASLRRLWDRHRARGLWAWPVTFMLALTGITLTFGEESRALVRTVSPVGDRLHYAMERKTPPPETIGIDRAIAIVSPRYGALYGVRPHPENGVYAVRTFDPRDMDNQGRLWTYIDMATGAVVGQRHDRGESAGDLFFAWQYALHSGHGLGIGGRIAVAAGGIVTFYLCWSGYALWWRRRRAPSRETN